MEKNISFTGFPEEATNFLRELALNNTKEWFEEHQGDYDSFVKIPAQNFVMAMGDKLREISPEIIADPRRDKSIFRIYRDTRFSKDKTPYKTHLGVYFWEGQGKKLECSGYYFHLEPPNLYLGVGIYIFSRDMLQVYREAVATPKKVKKLQKILGDIQSRGDYQVGGQYYKRVPRGFDKDDPNADLLKHNGLWGSVEMAIPHELYSEKLIDLCLYHYKNMLELHQWLVKEVQ